MDSSHDLKRICFPAVVSGTSSHTHTISVLPKTSPQDPNFTHNTPIIMSGQSNVGNSGVYEAGDQRNAPASEQNQAKPYDEGKENAHDPNDPSKQAY